MADPSESFGPDEASPIATEDQYARWARSFGIVDGVIGSGGSFAPGDLKVSANGSSSITVAAGEANICGVWYRNALPISRTLVPNTSATARIDSVVVRLDNASNDCSVKVIRGAAAKPALARAFGVTWDLILATVLIPAGASTVTTDAVTDARIFVAPGVTYANTGVSYPTAIPGMVQIRPGGRIVLGNADGTWTQAWPEADPTFVRFSYTSEIRDYDDGAGGGYAYGAYAQFANNTVQLRGLVESASGSAPTNVVIATLPVGMRPSSSRVFCAMSSAGSARITIDGPGDDAGKIRIDAGLASGGWISLDGINFWASN